MHLGRIDLVALQSVLCQSTTSIDDKLAVTHTKVGFDNDCLPARLLDVSQTRDDLYLSVPVAVLLEGFPGLVIHQVRGLPETTQNEIPVVVVLLAVSTYLPAHACVDRCM